MARERERVRRRRSPHAHEEAASRSYENKVFMQLLICVAIIISFLLIKEIELPSGKVVGGYVKNILSDSTDIEAAMSSAMVFARDNKLLPALTPAPSPTSPPSTTEEAVPQKDKNE